MRHGVGDGVRDFKVVGPAHFSGLALQSVGFNPDAVFRLDLLLHILVQHFFRFEFHRLAVEHTLMRVWTASGVVIFFEFVQSRPRVFLLNLRIPLIVSLVPEGTRVLSLGEVHYFCLGFDWILVMVVTPTSYSVCFGASFILLIFH